MVSVGMFRSNRRCPPVGGKLSSDCLPARGRRVRGGAFFETGVASANGGQSAADVAKSIAPANASGVKCDFGFYHRDENRNAVLPPNLWPLSGQAISPGISAAKVLRCRSWITVSALAWVLRPATSCFPRSAQFRDAIRHGRRTVFKPDPQTEVELQLDADSCPPTPFLGDIMTLAREHWSCCPRDFLRRGLTGLTELAGLRVYAAFEQEFVYTRRRSARSALLAGCVSPQRRFWPAAARRVARGRHHPQLIPRGIWALPIRGHSQTSRRAQGRR